MSSTATCPCCGAAIPGAVPLNQLGDLFPARMASILDALADGNTKSVWEIMDIVYGTNPWKWPNRPEDAVKVVISQQRARLAEFGWAIEGIRRKGYRLVKARRE